MRRVELVSVRELLYCLVLASSAMDYTLPRLHVRAFATSSHSTRVDLLRGSGSAQSELISLDHILHADSRRISFIIAKLSAAASPYAQLDSTAQSPLYSGQIIGGVNYVMKAGLGTPAKDLFLVIDTGSDLAWTQCLPCDACYQQQGPLFDPTASSSYRQVPCAAAQCAQLSLSACSGTTCEYGIVYLDGSSTVGDLALDTLTIGGNPVSSSFIFGCGHDNEGLFKGVDGLVGLSRDPLSLPMQTKATLGEVFAYCMPPVFSSSAGYIEFGGEGEGGMTTPLLGGSSFYVVELETIQVEGANSMSNAATKNSMVVDSGTVITRLSSALYDQVTDAFKKAASSIKAAPEGAGLNIFDSCYIASSASVFPRLTFTFAGGLAFTQSAQNSVFPIDNEGTFCLAILPFQSDVSILGSYHQQGHLFTFDIAHSTLGISSGAC